ncbi:MAG: phospholipid carrier-dependent glycosyltransferase [Desulfomonile sp.]|nr:phospholipid carrier-dependent glycosyltransferase [Desulfomonile sp.]
MVVPAMSYSGDAVHSSTSELRVHAEIDPALQRSRQAIVFFVGLAIVQFFVSWWLLTPGYIFLDEVWYHWMTRDFSATGSLELWNGYDELPSQELTPANLPARKGRIVSRYPYLFPVLALPFYRVFGFTGLVIVNSITFFGAVILCYAIARRLFRDDGLALRACLIFVFATFIWEYSQDAWPHTTSLFFLLAAFYLMVRAYNGGSSRSALVWAALSGFVAGFGPGIRIDNSLALPGLLAPFLFARPWRPREALSFALGAVPGLALLGWTNLIKFGRFNPFDYGDGTYLSWGLPLAALAVVAVMWLLSRPFCDVFVRTRKVLLAALAITALAGALAAPASRTVLLRGLSDFWVSVIDVRALDPALVLPPLERTPGGGMAYVGAMKKSLLQSLPYLPLLLVPIVRLGRGDRNAAASLMLLLIPICFVGYYSLFTHQYGGLCFNFRYFIPVLPFVAILTAYSLKEMKVAWGGSPSLFLLILPAALAAAAFYAWAGRPEIPLNSLDFPLLIAPLLIAGALLFLLVAGEIVNTEGARAIRGAAWVGTTVAITWAGMVAFFYDLPHHRDLREKNALWADVALRKVPGNSIYFAFPMVSPSIVDGDRIRIAFPGEDQGKDFSRLLEFHLKAGRRAFAAFSVDFWNSLKRGPLRDYNIIPMCSLPAGVVLGEITPAGNHGGIEKSD